MTNQDKLKEFQRLMAVPCKWDGKVHTSPERIEAVGMLAEAVFDSYEPADMKAFWKQIQTGDIGWQYPMHTWDSEILLAVAEETWGK